VAELIGITVLISLSSPVAHPNNFKELGHMTWLFSFCFQPYFPGQPPNSDMRIISATFQSEMITPGFDQLSVIGQIKKGRAMANPAYGSHQRNWLIKLP
jgi:hypothetical protein